MECLLNGKVVNIWINKEYRQVSSDKALVDTMACIYEVKTDQVGKDRKGKLLGRGIACQGKNDKYKRKFGNNLAILRALYDSGLTGRENKPVRKEFWDFYHKHYGKKKLQEQLHLV